MSVVVEKTIFGKVDGSILRNTWETEKTQLYVFFADIGRFYMNG